MNGKDVIFRVIIGLAVLVLPLSCAPTKSTPNPTAIPPTNTPTAIPPTNTPTAIPPTNTPTAIPPTNTPTAIPPTNTPTAIPPTNTPTAIPPTNTPTAIPPTNTPTAIPPTSTQTASSQGLLIDDCEDGDDKNLDGGYWYTYKDNERGGTSEVIPAPFECTPGGAQGTGFSAQMRGRVTTAFEYGFVGMGTSFSEPRAPRDISTYRGVSFWIKGDGKEYRISLPQASVGDFDYFGKILVAPQDWAQTTIIFSELSQEGWGTPMPWTGTDIFGVQWQTVGQPHDSIFLAIDELVFVR